MQTNLLVIIVISEVISAILIYKIIRSKESKLFKIAISLVALLPIVGPVFYGISMISYPLSAGLENRSNRGDYTHDWIGAKANMEKLNQTLTEISEKKDNKNSDKEKT